MTKKEWMSKRDKGGDYSLMTFYEEKCLNCAHDRKYHRAKTCSSSSAGWSHDSIKDEDEIGNGKCNMCKCEEFDKDEFSRDVERIRSEKAVLF